MSRAGRRVLCGAALGGLTTLLAIGLHALGMPAGLALVVAVASVGVGLWIGGEA